MEIQSYHKKTTKSGIKNNDIKDIYNSLDTKLNVITENFVNNNNKSLIKNVIKFIVDSYNNWKRDKITDSMIPVGALMIGVNLADHRKLFNSIAERAVEYNCKLVSINSVACKKKKILEILYRQILDEIPQIPRSYKGSMDVIIQYFLTKKTAFRTQITLVLEDVENFDSADIIQTLNVFSLFRQKCSFIVLFGICTNPDIIMDKLSAKCFSQVTLTYFQSPSPMDLLNGFLLELIKEKFPFMLNYSTCSYIIEQFLHTDYSISSIVQNLKICLHHHLSNNAEYAKLIRVYLNQSITNKDDLSPNKLQFEQYYLYWELFVAIYKWIQYFSSKMRIRRMGFSFYSILTAHLKTGIAKSEQLNSVLYNLKFEFPPSEISEFIEEANSALLQNKDSNKENQSSVNIVLSCFVNEISQVLQTNSKRSQTVLSKISDLITVWLNENLPHYSTSDQLNLFFFSINDKFSLQNMTNPSLLNALREDLLHPHRQAKLNSIKRQYSKKSRATTDSVSSNDDVSLNTPDMCILYRLFNEQSNQTINKFDLLQSFSSVIETGKEDEDLPSNDVQSRYLIGLLELEMLGLVASSKSKPDILTKLYWSGVF